MKKTFPRPLHYWNIPVCNRGTPIELHVSDRHGAAAYTSRLVPGTPELHDFIAASTVPAGFDGELKLDGTIP